MLDQVWSETKLEDIFRTLPTKIHQNAEATSLSSETFRPNKEQENLGESPLTK